MGDVILVTSGKSKIGKTVIGIKVGIELSKKGKNILLVDLSSGKYKISDYFNESENIIYDVKDVFDNTCSAEQATINVRDNLSIIPYPRVSNKLVDIKKESFMSFINEVKEAYDVIIVDMDSLLDTYYINYEDIYGIIMVDNNDFSAINNINLKYEIVNNFNIKKTIIINKYNKKEASKGAMLDLKEMGKILSTQIISTIEENFVYMNMTLDFLMGDEKNSFNYGVDNIIKSLY